MSKYFLPKFLKRMTEKKQRSAIINISSRGAIEVGKQMSIYSASKGFNRLLSIGMNNEYSDTIDVLTVVPAGV